MRRSAIDAAHIIALICVAPFVVGIVGAQTPPGRVFFRGDRGQSFEIYSMYANGTDLKNLTNFNWAQDEQPDVSPDGTRVVFSSTHDSTSEPYVMNADGSDQRRLTENAEWESTPRWSPDGLQILYFAFRAGRHGLWILDVSTSEERFVTEGGSGDWSPDGTHIIFQHPDDRSDLMRMRVDGADRVSLGIGGFGNGLAHPAWSPDGTHIAFDALRGGQWDIFTVENDGGRLRNVTNSSASSSTPAWTPDGARIVYNSGIENNRSLYTMLPDGGDVHRLTNHPGRDEHPSWFGSSDLTRDVSAKGKNPFTWAWIKHAGARIGAP